MTVKIRKKPLLKRTKFQNKSAEVKGMFTKN